MTETVEIPRYIDGEEGHWSETVEVLERHGVWVKHRSIGFHPGATSYGYTISHAPSGLGLVHGLDHEEVAHAFMILAKRGLLDWLPTLPWGERGNDALLRCGRLRRSDTQAVKAVRNEIEAWD